MPDAPQYTLTTIEDIYKLVPPDRWESCLAELLRSFQYAKELTNLMGVPGNLSNYTWIDDGKLNITVPVKAGGKTLFEFKVTGKESPNV